MDSILKLCLIFVYVRTCSADSDNEGIGNYSYISRDHCGIGHESSLTGKGMCFRWHNINQMVSNIENGRDVRLGEMPWLVRIVHLRADKTVGYHGSGTLLNERWIITAAHVVDCHFDTCLTPNMYRVLLVNNTHLKHRWEGHWVSEVYVHHKFTKNYTSEDYLLYDVALVKLKHPVRFVKSVHIWTFNGICLPKVNAFRHEYQYAIIAGVGYQQPVNDKSLGEAKMGWVRIHRTFNTSKQDSYGRLIKYVRIPFPNGTGFCAGDSGGPMLQYHHGRAVLVGINVAMESSGRTPCPTFDYDLSFSINVSPLIPWITCTVLGHRNCSQYN